MVVARLPCGVSIPHRYGKNLHSLTHLPSKYNVSIPHRYGKNQAVDCLAYCGKFVSIPHRYGKNIEATRITGDRCGFPFLIGTVRTISAKSTSRNSWGVSIPHRYGKNWYFDAHSTDSSGGFHSS